MVCRVRPVVQTGTVDKPGIFHAQIRRPGVHHFHKRRLTAGNMLCHSASTVIGRRDRNGLDHIPNPHRLSNLQIDLASPLGGGSFRGGHCIFPADAALIDSFHDQQHGHYLGNAGRSQRLVGIGLAANAVRILPVDILTEQFFHEGYLLNTCWEPESFEFTASRALTEAKPSFPADFSCSYTLSPEHILHITFPQAQTNGYRVNSYTLVLRSSEGDIMAQKKISSSYYRTAMPKTLSLELPFDYAAGDYTLELFANGFWLTRSDKYVQTISL